MADSYVYDLGMVVWCAWMTTCVSKIGWEAVIECKGLEIRPIRGGYMLTNQRSNEPAAMMAAADTGSSIYRTEGC